MYLLIAPSETQHAEKINVLVYYTFLFKCIPFFEKVCISPTKAALIVRRMGHKKMTGRDSRVARTGLGHRSSLSSAFRFPCPRFLSSSLLAIRWRPISIADCVQIFERRRMCSGNVFRNNGSDVSGRTYHVPRSRAHNRAPYCNTSRPTEKLARAAHFCYHRLQRARSSVVERCPDMAEPYGRFTRTKCENV